MLATAKGVAVVARPVPGAVYTVPAFAKRPLCPDQHATDKRLHADELADARSRGEQAPLVRPPAPGELLWRGAARRREDADAQIGEMIATLGPLVREAGWRDVFDQPGGLHIFQAARNGGSAHAAERREVVDP